MVTLKWEEIKDSEGKGSFFSKSPAVGGHILSRARVHGGWLVREDVPPTSGGSPLTFVPDPKNEWK